MTVYLLSLISESSIVMTGVVGAWRVGCGDEMGKVVCSIRSKTGREVQYYLGMRC